VVTAVGGALIAHIAPPPAPSFYVCLSSSSCLSSVVSTHPFILSLSLSLAADSIGSTAFFYTFASICSLSAFDPNLSTLLRRFVDTFATNHFSLIRLVFSSIQFVCVHSLSHCACVAIVITLDRNSLSLFLCLCSSSTDPIARALHNRLADIRLYLSPFTRSRSSHRPYSFLRPKKLFFADRL
jgi:uncharacterized membrane protein YhaH (DUF805 family)